MMASLGMCVPEKAVSSLMVDMIKSFAVFWRMIRFVLMLLFTLKKSENEGKRRECAEINAQ